MKTMRRMLALLLTACMLLCLAPAALADGPEFTDVSAAAKYIRSAMIARETELTYDYLVPVEELGEVNGDTVTNYMADLWEEIEAALFLHTGAPDAGDYLRWHTDQYGYGWGLTYSSQSPVLRYEVTVSASYYTDFAQEKEVTDRLTAVTEQLGLDGKSDYEKVKTITDFICDTVTYDYDNLYDDTYMLKYSAYAALINGTSVCQGYANLFYRMALLAGLDCRIVTGPADNGEAIEGHAWNVVKVDGKYYWIDPTWIDGTGSDEYFLQGKNGFGDHFPDEEFTTPAFLAAYPIADTAYDPADLPQPCAHVWDDGVQTTPPTCTEDGEMRFTCALCGATKTESIPATGHRYGAPVYEWSDDYRTCTAKVICANNESHVISETAVCTVDTVKPTCTDEGKTVYTAAFANKLFYSQVKVVPIPALGHDFGDWKEKTKPTCTAPGEGSRVCSRCGIEETGPIPALGHQFGDWKETTKPTCTAPGEGSRVCSRCGIEKTGPIPALGHDFGDWNVKTAPTCTVPGEGSHVCSRCGIEEFGPIPALGHDLIDHEGKAPTCTEPGWEAYQTCTRCAYSTYAELDPIGHSFGAPTYEWGEGYLTCTARAVCANDETHVIEETVKSRIETKDPTCTEDGKTVYSAGFSSRRFYTQYHEEPIPALGHDFGEWTVTATPTCTEAGQESRACSRCTVKETRPIPALGHDFGEWQTVTPATPEAEGVEQRLCSRCSTVETRAIPKLPAPAYLLGDVDGDGKIGTADARMALRIAIGLEPTLTPDTAAYMAADIDLDGNVGTGDARLILRRAIGIIDADKWGIRK